MQPEAPTCSRGFDATFIQLEDSQLHYGYREWAPILERFRRLGIRTVVLQYTGDEHGPYEGRKEGAAPIRSLLEMASERGIDVFLGLHADRSWPSRFDPEVVPPPLNDETSLQSLGALCREHPSCAGFYLSPEIDDSTWAGEAQRSPLRAWLERASARLQLLVPNRRIAIAPFFTGALSPEEHAAFYSELLRNRPVDLVMLQDGIGSGHGGLDALGPMLSAMRPVLDRQGIELWSVLELFDQESGPPRDDSTFSARPASFGRVLLALREQRPHVRRVVAFTVLDYMAPERGERAAALYRSYLRYCL